MCLSILLPFFLFFFFREVRLCWKHSCKQHETWNEHLRDKLDDDDACDFFPKLWEEVCRPRLQQVCVHTCNSLVYILSILSCTYLRFSRVHTFNSLLLPVFLCVALVFWCRIFLYRLNYLLRKVVAISQHTTRLQRQNRDAEDLLLLHRLFIIFAIASAVRLPLTDYYPLSRNPLGPVT